MKRASTTSVSKKTERTSTSQPPPSTPPVAFLPFKAEYLSAKKKRFAETVVFVHHFGGSTRSLRRHGSLVNDLGFDAVVFNLMFSHLNPNRHLPITAYLKFGARHVWTEQIEAILNAVPGKKILYSFSMPSNSALAAIAHRGAEDVVAWVADGGPFLQLPLCVWNLYAHQYQIKSRVLRGGLTAASLVFYGAGFESEVPALLRSLPIGFPILSIRGLADPLVPSEAIDDVLLHRTDLGLQSLTFAEGVHLDGLKNFTAEYSEKVRYFLESAATHLA
jgi:hypothetical protein